MDYSNLHRNHLEHIARRSKLPRPCSANDVNIGGGCFNCGFDPDNENHHYVEKAKEPSPSDPLNPAALHVRIINTDGTTEDVCSLASFVRNNEHDAQALLKLGWALRTATPTNGDLIAKPYIYPDVYRQGPPAHAWRYLGAGGTVGLVIEEGPCPPREPDPDDTVCERCGGRPHVIGWIDTATGEATDDICDDDAAWCPNCGADVETTSRAMFEATRDEDEDGTDATA